MHFSKEFFNKHSNKKWEGKTQMERLQKHRISFAKWKRWKREKNQIVLQNYRKKNCHAKEKPSDGKDFDEKFRMREETETTWKSKQKFSKEKREKKIISNIKW